MKMSWDSRSLDFFVSIRICILEFVGAAFFGMLFLMELYFLVVSTGQSPGET